VNTPAPIRWNCCWEKGWSLFAAPWMGSCFILM